MEEVSNVSQDTDSLVPGAVVAVTVTRAAEPAPREKTPNRLCTAISRHIAKISNRVSFLGSFRDGHRQILDDVHARPGAMG
jgi:hypothetical protein